MTTYTFDENIVSDLHKDARGFRPSQLWWEGWIFSTDDRKQVIWDSLLVELEGTMTEDARREAAALEAFEALIAKNIELGASDKATAIRWILEAEDMGEFDLAYGADYVAYTFSLSYSNPYKAEIQAVIDEMKRG